MDTGKQTGNSLTYTWTNANVHTKNNNTRTVYDALMTCCRAKSSLKESREKQLLKNGECQSEIKFKINPNRLDTSKIYCLSDTFRV